MSQFVTLFINILLPVFAIVLLGYLAGPRLQIESRSISRLAYYILSPSLLFSVLVRADIDLALAARMLLFILTVTLGSGIVALLLAWLLGCSGQMMAAFILVAVYGNVANFGLPIIQFKLGDAGLLPASVYYLFLSVTGFTLGVGAATWHKGGGLSALGVIFRTPAILAAILAVAVNRYGITPPLFVERAVGLLASALVPTILLGLGTQLAHMGRPQLNRTVIAAGLVRLVAGPVLALGLAAPFGITGLTRGAGILQASMPTAVIASLIALEHDLVPDFVTTVVLFSTIVSSITLTIVLAIV